MIYPRCNFVQKCRYLGAKIEKSQKSLIPVHTTTYRKARAYNFVVFRVIRAGRSNYRGAVFLRPASPPLSLLWDLCRAEGTEIQRILDPNRRETKGRIWESETLEKLGQPLDQAVTILDGALAKIV